MAEDDQANNDEPRAMSQEEINSLFKQLEDETTSSKAAPKESAGAESGQNAIDDSLAQAAPEPTSEPAGPLGQDDIDALLNAMQSGDDAPTEAEGAKEEEAPEPSGPLGQDDIDALLNAMQGDDAPAEVEKEEVAEPSGPLGQDDIDALLNAMQGGDDAPVEEEQAQVEESAESSGPLGQDDIDALLSAMQGGDEAPAEKEAEEPSGPLGQDDIDALLNSMNADEPEVVSAADTIVNADASEDRALGQDDIDDLLAQLTDPDPSPAVASDADGQMGGQDDIDALLKEMGMGGDNGQAAPDILSTEQIAGIVDGQASQEFPDEDTEEMISQGDIDSLVREMSQATGVPDQNEIDARVAENESDIEALLQEAADPMATVDAVQGSLVLGQGASAPPQYAAVDPAAVMAPDELRGTRYLLVAAVFLLAMCAVTMGFVVRSINDLSHELEKNRTSEIKPVDDFQENISYARKMLASEDALELGRGLIFIKRLKENHEQEPDKIIIISLLLADHYRSTGAYSKARIEYELMTDRQGMLYENPQYYLDYSETLFALGEKKYDDAIAVLYRLMANEQYYISTNDSQGNARDVDLVTLHEKIIQEAYLMLGQIFTAQLDAGAPQMRRGPS